MAQSNCFFTMDYSLEAELKKGGYEYTKEELEQLERLDKEIDGMLFTLPQPNLALALALANNIGH
jgi:hypothetical protein